MARPLRVDDHGDFGWHKKVLRQRPTATVAVAVTPGSKATIHFAARVAGGAEALDDTRTLGTGPFELRCGKNFLIPAWELAIGTMEVGELAQFVFPPTVTQQYVELATVLRRQAGTMADECIEGSGACCMGRKLSCMPPDLTGALGQALEVDIELLKVELPGTFAREPWELPLAEKAGSIDLLRAEGNALFKAGDYAAAVDTYFLAMAYVEEVLRVEPDSATTVAQRVPLLLNLSLAQLRLGQTLAAVNYATSALEFEPRNAKALFRRGQAYLARPCDIDLAVTDLQAARQLAPRDAAIEATLATALRQRQEATKSDRTLCAVMLLGGGSRKEKEDGGNRAPSKAGYT